MNLFEAKTPDDVDLLILAGHDINCSDDSQNSPLHMACINGYFDVVKKLCFLGANIHVENNLDQKPIDEAAIYGYLEIVKFFVENYGIISNKLLCYSIVRNSTDVFDYVLTLNPNVDEIVRLCARYETALTMACWELNIYCVDKLLNAGANVNITICNNESPLLITCSNKDSDKIEQIKGIIQRLLFFGANINHQSVYDYGDIETHYSCLRYVCESQNMLDIVKLLISQNANVNLLTSYNETPLITACINYNYEYIPYLLEAGANVDINDNDGHNALNLCSDKEMKELLTKYKN